MRCGCRIFLISCLLITNEEEEGYTVGGGWREEGKMRCQKKMACALLVFCVV
jgi:hypothetical protein